MNYDAWWCIHKPFSCKQMMALSQCPVGTCLRLFVSVWVCLEHYRQYCPYTGTLEGLHWLPGQLSHVWVHPDQLMHLIKLWKDCGAATTLNVVILKYHLVLSLANKYFYVYLIGGMLCSVCCECLEALLSVLFSSFPKNPCYTGRFSTVGHFSYQKITQTCTCLFYY